MVKSTRSFVFVFTVWICLCTGVSGFGFDTGLVQLGSDQFNDEFGRSVAVCDDVLVVGAPLYNTNNSSTKNAGAVFIFQKSYFSNGVVNWKQKQKLVISNANQGDRLGAAVAIDGDTIVAGANYGNVNGKNNAGYVYVFEKQNNSWVAKQKLTMPEGFIKGGAKFGGSVAISGDLLVVGTQYFTLEGYNEPGCAVLYERDGNGYWNFIRIIVPPPGYGKHFGNSVSISGDTIVVGWKKFHYGNKQNFEDMGAVMVYERKSNNHWSQGKLLIASDFNKLDRFGHAVSVSGDTIVVGAVNAKNDEGKRYGGVYIFEKQNDEWTQVKEMKSNSTGDRWGASVLVFENTMVFGSPNSSIQSRVRVYQKNDGQWNQIGIFASQGNKNFGSSVSIHKNALMIGKVTKYTEDFDIIEDHQEQDEHEGVGKVFVADLSITSEDSRVFVYEDTIAYAGNSDFSHYKTSIDGTVVYNIVQEPAHGKLYRVDNTRIRSGETTPYIERYVPDADFNGRDTYTYFVSIDGFTGNTATCTINVRPLNDSPIVINNIEGVNVCDTSIPKVIDLASVFDDVDIQTNNDSLRYEVYGATNLFTNIDITGTTLTLFYKESWTSSDYRLGRSGGTVIVEARDSIGARETASFYVNIKSPDSNDCNSGSTELNAVHPLQNPSSASVRLFGNTATPTPTPTKFPVVFEPLATATPTVTPTPVQEVK